MKKPKHIAIIMDGNRRWARKKGLGILTGHEYAAKNVTLSLAKECLKLKIPYLTLWTWSTENWNRRPHEVKGILSLFRKYFEPLADQLNQLHVKINTIGDLSRFPSDIQKLVKKWQKITKNNQKLTLTSAINYGGHDEILRAIKKLSTESLKPSAITEHQFSQFLDTADLPDPDLIIRTGGEFRLSGFLPWQSAYSELYFTKTLFPDFTPAKFRKAIQEYGKRQRRFGK